MNTPVAGSALSMRAVTKQYPQKRALDALDFNVASGCVKGLLGRNGAGKTTLIESALGLRPIDAGEIRLLGEAPGAFSEAVRSRIGYVAQDADLFEWMTGQQMLEFFSAFYPRWNADKVAALLDRWSVPSSVRIGQLSGGERQRLAIIRALAHEPDFLLLDEPVASLDPAGRRDFLKEVVDLTVDRGTTVLFSTHIVSDLERIASDVAIMANGRIALDQPIDDLTERTFRLTGPAAALSVAGGRVLSRGKAGEWEQCIVLFPDGSPAALEGLRANGLRVEPVGLEDILIEATR